MVLLAVLRLGGAGAVRVVCAGRASVAAPSAVGFIGEPRFTSVLIIYLRWSRSDGRA
jgi:hypothetical protein